MGRTWEAGGNVEGSKPEETVTTAGGVKIIGYANAPAHIPVDASLLYARNLSAFLALLVDKERGLHIDISDEIIKGALLTIFCTAVCAVITGFRQCAQCSARTVAAALQRVAFIACA